MLENAGYQLIGGLTNRVYRDQENGDILKLGLEIEPLAVQNKLAAFQKCLDLSREYAPLGLMPPVLEVGADFLGTGHPFLRERYVPGTNLSAAYLQDPVFWLVNLPGELCRIYQGIQTAPSIDITATWQDKLDGMRCPPGFDGWFDQVRRTGQVLMKQFPKGWRIHGDLQFGNLLALDHKPGKVMLIDWEMSEVMPISYEFAMFYAFLADPDGQVDPPLREAYRQQTPLVEIWRGVLSSLINHFDLGRKQIEDMILFRMGNAWLYQLSGAIENHDTRRAEELVQQLEKLLGGSTFASLPVDDGYNP